MEKINGLDVYKITVDDKYLKDGAKDLGWDLTAFTSKPAILTKGVAFSADGLKKFSFKDDLKMRIAAPALIPMNIYREDEWGEYYVQFTAEEIEAIYKKFMRTLSNDDKFNLEHSDEKVPAYILECILCDTDNKIQYVKDEYGIAIPKGSVFLVSQITDEQYYNKLVSNDQTGYSIEGFLGFKMSEIINKQKTDMAEKLMLPDGEHKINDKVYVVKDGELIEIKDAVEMAEEAETEAKDEEVKAKEEELAEDAKDEEVKAKEEELAEDAKEEELAEDAKEEELAEEAKAEEVKMDIDAEELMVLLQPKFDEIYQMISDIKVKIAEKHPEDVEDKVEEIEMSVHQRFSAVADFINK